MWRVAARIFGTRLQTNGRRMSSRFVAGRQKMPRYELLHKTSDLTGNIWNDIVVATREVKLEF